MDSELAREFYRQYVLNPKKCNHCGAPLNIHTYVRQFNNDYMFCSAECSNEFLKIKKSSDFVRKECKSSTELVILNFLKWKYPKMEIKNNVSDLLPPYEFDFTIPAINTVIEFNGVYHFTECYGAERLARVQARDLRKKKDLCTKLNWNCISVCSPYGLYTRPNVFKKILSSIAMKIDMLKSDFHYGYSAIILADEDESSITVKEESFLKEAAPVKRPRRPSSKKYYNTHPGKKVSSVGLKRKTKKKKRRG